MGGRPKRLEILTYRCRDTPRWLGGKVALDHGEMVLSAGIRRWRGIAVIWRHEMS